MTMDGLSSFRHPDLSEVQGSVLCCHGDSDRVDRQDPVVYISTPCIREETAMTPWREASASICELLLRQVT